MQSMKTQKQPLITSYFRKYTECKICNLEKDNNLLMCESKILYDTIYDMNSTITEQNIQILYLKEQLKQFKQMVERPVESKPSCGDWISKYGNYEI